MQVSSWQKQVLVHGLKKEEMIVREEDQFPASNEILQHQWPIRYLQPRVGRGNSAVCYDKTRDVSLSFYEALQVCIQGDWMLRDFLFVVHPEVHSTVQQFLRDDKSSEGEMVLSRMEVKEEGARGHEDN
uniref:Uncharacterized protein n=1 Tax=Lepeophtheirus salmonis TaxID=72036 RepID=A0A0K2TZF4_LEPSM